MNTNNRWLVIVLLTSGTFISLFRGNEARQKWVFKMKNKYEEKRQLAEHRKLLREGGVALDDIEMAAFHK